MEVQEIIGEAEPEPKKPKRRGRPPKDQKEKEEAEQRAREEKEKAERIGKWEDVSKAVLFTVSALVNSKFPTCGPTEDEIEAVSPSVAYLLDYYMPEGDEVTMHWGNVAAVLLLPTGMRIMKHTKASKNGVSKN